MLPKEAFPWIIMLFHVHIWVKFQLTFRNKPTNSTRKIINKTMSTHVSHFYVKRRMSHVITTTVIIQIKLWQIYHAPNFYIYYTIIWVYINLRLTPNRIQSRTCPCVYDTLAWRQQNHMVTHWHCNACICGTILSGIVSKAKWWCVIHQQVYTSEFIT
jgi:hypothetical protein